MQRINSQIVSCLVATLLMQVVGSAEAQDLPAKMPGVNATTIVVANVDPAKTDLPDWLHTDAKLGQLASVVSPLQQTTDSLKAVSPDDVIHLAVDIPYSSSQPLVRMLIRKRPDTTELIKQHFRMGAPVARGDYLMVSPTQDKLSQQDGLDESVMSADRPGFTEAARVVQDYPIRILLNPPSYLWRTFDELLPELPAKFGGGPVSVVTRGLRWAAVGIDLSNLRMSATIQSESHADAVALSKRIPKLLELAVELQTQHEQIKTLANAMMASLDVRVDGDQIRISFKDMETDDAKKQMLAGVAARLTGPLSRGAKRDQFRSILLGVLNFESANGSFPPAKRARDKDGKSGLSWRVHILPYLDQAALYDRFRLNEAWDSPHNKKLLAEMPDVFNVRSRFSNSPDIPQGYTTYVAPVGDGTVFGGDKATRFREIRDGSSKTLMLVEVQPKHAVPWTAPQDYAFDPDQPSKGLAWDSSDITLGGFCDAHVAEIPRDFSEENFLRAFVMNDGKPVRFP